MSDNIDFDQLIDLLDRALVSDDPKVKKALKKFLFITALATEDEETEGPLRNLIRRIEALEAKANAGTFTWPSSYPGQVWYNTSGGTNITTAVSHQYVPPTNTAEIGDTFQKTTTSTSIDTLIDDSLNDLADLQKQASNLQK